MDTEEQVAPVVTDTDTAADASTEDSAETAGQTGQYDLFIGRHVVVARLYERWLSSDDVAGLRAILEALEGTDMARSLISADEITVGITETDGAKTESVQALDEWLRARGWRDAQEIANAMRNPLTILSRPRRSHRRLRIGGWFEYERAKEK